MHYVENLTNIPRAAHDEYSGTGTRSDREQPGAWLRVSRLGVGQGPTEIQVGVYLLDIPRIDDADQSYVADIFLRYEWKDARLANGRDAPCTVPAADIWNPGGLVANQRSVQLQMNEVVEVQADGTVRYVQRFYGTYSLPLELISSRVTGKGSAATDPTKELLAKIQVASMMTGSTCLFAVETARMKKACAFSRYSRSAPAGKASINGVIPSSSRPRPWLLPIRHQAASLDAAGSG